jgi:hypothetical protein
MGTLCSKNKPERRSSESAVVMDLLPQFEITERDCHELKELVVGTVREFTLWDSLTGSVIVEQGEKRWETKILTDSVAQSIRTYHFDKLDRGAPFVIRVLRHPSLPGPGKDGSYRNANGTRHFPTLVVSGDKFVDYGFTVQDSISTRLTQSLKQLVSSIKASKYQLSAADMHFLKRITSELNTAEPKFRSLSDSVASSGMGSLAAIQSVSNDRLEIALIVLDRNPKGAGALCDAIAKDMAEIDSLQTNALAVSVLVRCWVEHGVGIDDKYVRAQTTRFSAAVENGTMEEQCFGLIGLWGASAFAETGIAETTDRTIRKWGKVKGKEAGIIRLLSIIY